MIYWNEIKFFNPKEFSEDPDIYAEPMLIYDLDELRMMYKNSIYPSPVKGSLARKAKSASTSQHFVDSTHKSKAIDVFPVGVPYLFFMTAIASKKFGGIGVYFNRKGLDGKLAIEFHLDIRKDRINGLPIVWFVEDVDDKEYYRYPQAESKYWGLLNNERMYKDRQY